MRQQQSEESRQRIVELAESPIYRPFIVSYLVAALDERYWPQLVQAALEHVERQEDARSARERLAQQLHEERWR